MPFQSKLDPKGRARLYKEVREGKNINDIFVWLWQDYEVTARGAYYLIQKAAKDIGDK